MIKKNFHEGEEILQEKVGMREKINVMSQHMMRDHMPDQHREFFENLTYIFIGTIDHTGLSYASIVTGDIGFVRSPNPQTLIIQIGQREKEAAFQNLMVGSAIGILGLDLSNRRRNRMHGLISALDDTTLTISVVQSYGNCPKYISLREISKNNIACTDVKVQHRYILSEDDTQFIAKADTFFIASYVQDNSGAPYEGVDISHRGGEAGFISIDHTAQITIPDYKGNNLFNTLGNILINPEVGLLFIDFETGAQLQLQGHAVIIESEEAVKKFPGAQRLLEVKINSVTHISDALSLRWRYVENSMFNPSLS